MRLDQFLATLFDKGQQTCFANSANGYKVKRFPSYNDVFFAINALDFQKDNVVTEDWHREQNPRRADGNVVCFRNFLIELDTNESIQAQIDYVTSKVPVSSIVHSGNKSCHFIISLKEPLSTIEEYRHVALRLHTFLPQSDPTQKNASRLSRLPFRVRPDTKNFQKLLYLGERIDNEKLLNLLPKIEIPEYKQVVRDSREGLMLSVELVTASTEPDSFMLKKGFGGRNAFFFWLGKKLQEIGLDYGQKLEFVERTYINLANKKDFSYNEARAAARLK